MKRFSQLAIPYIAWAAMMLVLPMALIALYSNRYRAMAAYRP
jgi:spermidine/putrescine transport system permease protein